MIAFSPAPSLPASVTSAPPSRNPIRSPVRRRSPPECEVPASPHITAARVVGTAGRSPPLFTATVHRHFGGSMTTSVPATLFTEPAAAHRLERAAGALRANNFTVEILDDAVAARTRVKDLVPAGASVFTGASETLRLSGIEADITNSGRYDAVRARSLTMDR